jgi:hypothetical protein
MAQNEKKVLRPRPTALSGTAFWFESVETWYQRVLRVCGHDDDALALPPPPPPSAGGDGAAALRDVAGPNVTCTDILHADSGSSYPEGALTSSL